MLQSVLSSMRHHVLVIEKNKIDIARIVQFPRPQLSHSENDQAAVIFGVLGVR